MRRRDHPSFPSEITCCFLSVLKTLLMPSEPIRALSGVNVPGFPMAGFQLTLYGRIWATPEDQDCRPSPHSTILSDLCQDIAQDSDTNRQTSNQIFFGRNACRTRSKSHGERVDTFPSQSPPFSPERARRSRALTGCRGLGERQQSPQ